MNAILTPFTTLGMTIAIIELDLEGAFGLRARPVHKNVENQSMKCACQGPEAAAKRTTCFPLMQLGPSIFHLNFARIVTLVCAEHPPGANVDRAGIFWR